MSKNHTFRFRAHFVITQRKPQRKMNSIITFGFQGLLHQVVHGIEVIVELQQFSDSCVALVGQDWTIFGEILAITDWGRSSARNNHTGKKISYRPHLGNAMQLFDTDKSSLQRTLVICTRSQRCSQLLQFC